MGIVIVNGLLGMLILVALGGMIYDWRHSRRRADRPPDIHTTEWTGDPQILPPVPFDMIVGGHPCIAIGVGGTTITIQTWGGESNLPTLRRT